VAHSLSAAKRHRQSLRRHERNQARISAARSAVRRAREAIAGDGDAEAAVQRAGSVLDRAASKGALHRNNASRRKSRLMKALHSRGAPPAATPRATRSRKKS
jgi:small subunit ribosomal protein S20